MFEIPTSLTIGGRDFPIRNRGDFRMVFDCFSALNDIELDKEYRILTCMVIFFDGMNDFEDVISTFGNDLQEAVEEMFSFIRCGQEENPVEQPVVVDWEKDAPLIASAINVVANKEIRFESYLHWWTFMGYYNAIGESTFSTIVGIRYKIKKGKKLEDYEKDFRRDNPQYFVWNDSRSNEDKQFEADLLANFKTGGQ